MNKKLVAKTFKRETGNVIKAIDELEDACVRNLKMDLDNKKEAKVGAFTVTPEMFLDWKEIERTYQEEKFLPNVIEPSFGIGRIIYSLLEQTFKVRGDEKRTYFSFPPSLATYKCVFLPLLNKEDLVKKVEEMDLDFRRSGIMCRKDCGSSAIGKRYARTDEMGIPFAITVDFETLENDTVTLREINSMKQIRVPCGELKNLVNDFVENDIKFESLFEKYPPLNVEEA